MIDEFERVLGRIEKGLKPGGGAKEVQLVQTTLPGQPDLTVFATLGLSNHELNMGNGKTLNIELVTALRDDACLEPIPSLLIDVAEHALREQRCPLRGEIIGPKNNSFVPGADFSAIYFTTPLFRYDEDRMIRRGDGREVYFIWVLAITGAEAKFVRESGWDNFEGLLDEDLTSLFTLPRGSFIA